LPNITPGMPESGLQDGVGLGTGVAESTTPAPTLLAGNTQPPALPFSAAPAASSASSPNETPGIMESGLPADGVGVGVGIQAAESIPQVNEAVESTATVPVLLASASGPTAGVLSSTETNLQSIPANASDSPATGAVNQNEFALPTGTANALSAILNGQNAAPPILTPPGQALPGRAAPRFAAARVSAGASATSVRGAGQIPVSTSSSALSAGSDTSELPVASQTPFSVFFSSAGPGTDAAASALPKMILPVTGSTVRNGYAAAAPAGTSPQAGGLPSSATQLSPQANKDSLAGSQGGSLPAGQPLHSNGDPSTSNIPAVTSQTPAAPPAPLPSATVAAPTGGQPGLPVDSLSLSSSSPKPETLPGSTGGGAASLVPAAPQVPSTLPGPVQVAQLVNRMGQSEMRIGMNTSAFGGVEVRTVVHASDVGLIIGSEKGDLRGLLGNEMPAITNSLQQQNLRLNSVNFTQGSAFSNNSSGGGASQQQRSFVPAPAYVNSALSEATVEDPAEALLAVEFGGGGSSLSILA